MAMYLLVCRKQVTTFFLSFDVGASTGAIAMIEVKEDAGCVSKVLREHKDSISDICAGVIADHSIVVSFRVGFQKEANMSIP